MSDTILTVDGVRKSFGRLVAVNNLSFSVAQGEIFGIAGPNGSGKSTLFNILTNVPFRPDSGTVAFLGRDISRLAPSKVCKLGMARTFQRETVFESLSVWENVALGAIFGGLDRVRSDVLINTDRALERMRLQERRGELARNLTVFEKKRLMIASAIATKPVLLLLDEPASGLTGNEIQQLEESIVELNRDGVTVLLIEHVLPLLLGVSQRLMVLNYGELLTIAPPAEVIRNPDVIEAYLGREAAQDVS